MSFETIQYRVADTGVAFISIDVPGLDVNVLTPELHREVGEIATQLAGDDSASGAVLHSGKQGFMAGGDLKRIVGYYDMDRTAADAYEQSRAFSRSLRQLETCGKPVAVAGAAGSYTGPYPWRWRDPKVAQTNWAEGSDLVDSGWDDNESRARV